MRAAAVLLLTLPGAAFVYQGDEIGLANGPGARAAASTAPAATGCATRCSGTRRRRLHDRRRRGCRSSTPSERNVEDAAGDPGSLLNLYRRLIELRRGLGSGFRLLDAEPGVVAFERDGHTIAVNTTAEPRPAPARASPCSRPTRAKGLPPHAALIVRK